MSHICSGALFFARDTERFLFLHRTQSKRSRVWGIAGGNNESGESAWQACEREIFEEIGEVEIEKTIPLETFVSHTNNFVFHTYLCVVKQEFIPVLNREHDGYAWAAYSAWPRPLHYGLKNTLNKKQNIMKIETIFYIRGFIGK